MINTIIEITNVSKYYHRGSETVHAVDGISLSIPRGEFTAIVGHSGSGKTTLLNLIGCLDAPTRGDVVINGHAVHSMNEKERTLVRRSSIGFVFQQFFLIPTLTVLENVMLPSLFTRTQSEGRAEELLASVGLEKRMKHLPGELSGGEMQRVAIARALINKPAIVLADEPTGNLDHANTENVMSIFQSLNSGGITFVMVTHNYDLAKRAARTVHIEDGRISN